MQTERNVTMNNGVFYISIPIDLVRYLDMKETDTLVIQDEQGKHGKYMSIWIKRK